MIGNKQKIDLLTVSFRGHGASFKNTTFESATTKINDVRELIPEFYYFLEMNVFCNSSYSSGCIFSPLALKFICIDNFKKEYCIAIFNENNFKFIIKIKNLS